MSTTSSPPAEPESSGPPFTDPLLRELAWREMLHQHTDGIEARLAQGPVRGYCGFDPTGPSLHVGHLLPVMGLVQLQRHGHQPVALVGGVTGLIGDPSGRAAERTLQGEETIAANTAALRGQLERFLDFSGPRGALMRDNATWLRPMTVVELMRDVGKHFTVNYMLAKESVRNRMEAGLSYTEFSYMLLQAYDFLELHRRDGVTLQVGGSDQWGNMTAGMELIRRTAGGQADVLTFPLLTKADGSKFGKSAGDAVWLDAERTTPYAFHQFWMNSEDQEVGRLLRLFTLLPREEVEALDAATAAHPERRAAQQALAADVTARVHGAAEARAAREVAALLFGGGDPRQLSPEALAALRREVPFAEVGGEAAGVEGGGAPEDALADGLALLVAAGLAASRGAAKRLAEQGGLYVNGERRGLADRFVRAGDLLPGRHVLLRKGARDYALVHLPAR